MIVAHRGGAPGDVDNSLSAFEHAIDIGADLIECDLRRSSDGVIVLYHDERIDGVAVKSHTFSELRRQMPGLLTLDDLLMLVSSKRATVRLALDLKERGLELALIPVLEQRPDMVNKVLVSTVHTLSLRRLSRRFPNLRLALSRGHLIGSLPHPALQRLAAATLRHIYPFWMVPQLRWCGAGAVAMHHRLLTPAIVERFHRQGFRVYAWTVDDLATAEALSAAGVDMIASNQPWELLGLLGRRD